MMEGVPQYYLAYHGRNNRRVNRRIAELYRRATPGADFTAPFTRTYEPPAPGAPLRVGFISLYFRDHSVSKMVAGVLEVRARPPREPRPQFPSPRDPPAPPYRSPYASPTVPTSARPRVALRRHVRGRWGGDPTIFKPRSRAV